MKKLKFKTYQTNCNIWEIIEDSDIHTINFDGLDKEFKNQEELEKYIKDEIMLIYGSNIDDLDNLVFSISINYQ